MSNDDSSVSRGAKIITEPEEATGSNDASTCIFVGGIGKNFTIEELKSLFEPYGTVVSAYVQRSKTTNKPLGYGFVNLATREEAERCIRSCHRKPLFGQAITVSWAERNRCLLVMHIPPTVTLDEIITLFETNGTIDRDESEEGQAGT
jgi:RNA recognition motif-containing protein